MSSDVSICQRDIYTILLVASSWGLQLSTEKSCVSEKKSFIERLVIAQFGNYYVCGVGVKIYGIKFSWAH